MLFGEWVPGGKGQKLIDTFGQFVVADGGHNRDAALFAEKSDDRRDVTFYLSPSGAQIALSILKPFGLVPCSRPAKIPQMVVGDDRAKQLLWPKEQENS